MSQPQPIRLVVCDIAGTTVNDNQNVHLALQLALAQFSVVVTPEDINPLMGYPKPIAIETLLRSKLPDPEAITPSLIDRIHDRFVAEMVHFYQTDPQVREKPDAAKTLISLRQHGITVALDTGFDRLITDAILERLGWLRDGVIDFSVTSDEVPRGRPYPDLIWAAMQKVGITDPGEVMKVGDTSSDLQEGMAAQCRYVVGVTTGSFSREQLESEPHTHLIDQLSQLLDILGIQ